MSSRTLRGISAIASLAAACILTLSVLFAPAAQAGTAQGHRAPTPAGFDRYLVFMAEGIFDNLFGDAEFFHRQIMGRTTEQIAEQKAMAIAFFKERFGVDFSASDQASNVTLMLFTLTPDLDYRAYTASGERVPAEGWEIRDGGWIGLVGPGGTTFHGVWGGSVGKTVPEGTLILFGDYNVRRLTPSDLNSRGEARLPDASPILIHYQSRDPMIPDEDGRSFLVCDLHSAEFGDGIALGIIWNVQTPDGRTRQLARNVLTFPPFKRLGP